MHVLSGLAVLVGVTCLGTVRHEGRAALLRSWTGAVVYGSGDLTERTLWSVNQRIGAIWFLLALFWGTTFAALFCEASVHSYLGRYLLCCGICFLELHMAAVECPGRNVCRRFSLSWLFRQRA